MKEFDTKCIYYDDEGIAHVVVLDKSNELELPIVDVVNVSIIDSSILNNEDFSVDGDGFYIKSKDLFEHLDTSKTYFLISSDSKILIIEYCESRFIDLMCFLSGGVEFYFSDEREVTSSISNNYFY